MTVKQVQIANALRTAARYARAAGAGGIDQVAEILAKLIGLSPKGRTLGGHIAAPFTQAKNLIHTGRELGIGVGELAKANPRLVGELAGTVGLAGGTGAGVAGLLTNKSAAFAEGFIDACMRMRVSPSALVKAAQAMDPAAAQAAEAARRKANAEKALNTGSFASRQRAASGRADPYGELGALEGTAHRLRDWWFDNTVNTALGRSAFGPEAVEEAILRRQGALGEAVRNRQIKLDEARKVRDAALGRRKVPMSVAGKNNPYYGSALFNVLPYAMSPATNPVQLKSMPTPAAPVTPPTPTPTPTTAQSPTPTMLTMSLPRIGGGDWQRPQGIPTLPDAPRAPTSTMPEPTAPPSPAPSAPPGPVQPIKPLVPAPGAKRTPSQVAMSMPW